MILLAETSMRGFPAGAWTIDPVHSDVFVTAKHPEELDWPYMWDKSSLKGEPNTRAGGLKPRPPC